MLMWADLPAGCSCSSGSEGRSDLGESWIFQSLCNNEESKWLVHPEWSVCVCMCVRALHTHTHERSHTCMRCLASTAVSKDGQVMMPPPPWYIVTRHLWPCAVGRLRTGKHIQLVKWSCMLEVDVRHRLLTTVDI